jgi:ABC-type molybdate transport system substrate-binding protein
MSFHSTALLFGLWHAAKASLYKLLLFQGASLVVAMLKINDKFQQKVGYV